jgi:hypothetical protein
VPADVAAVVPRENGDPLEGAALVLRFENRPPAAAALDASGADDVEVGAPNRFDPGCEVAADGVGAVPNRFEVGCEVAADDVSVAPNRFEVGCDAAVDEAG